MRRTKQITLSGTFLAMAAMSSVGLTGCSDSEEQQAYCGDENGTVVEDTKCDDDVDAVSSSDDDDNDGHDYSRTHTHALNYIYLVPSNTHYRIGQTIPKPKSGWTRAVASNPAQRTSLGLPGRGGFGGNGARLSGGTGG